MLTSQFMGIVVASAGQLIVGQGNPNSIPLVSPKSIMGSGSSVVCMM